MMMNLMEIYTTFLFDVLICSNLGKKLVLLVLISCFLRFIELFASTLFDDRHGRA